MSPRPPALQQARRCGARTRSGWIAGRIDALAVLKGVRGELLADPRHLLAFQGGEQVAPGAKAPIIPALGKTLLDEDLHAPVLGVYHAPRVPVSTRHGGVPVSGLVTNRGSAEQRKIASGEYG